MEEFWNKGQGHFIWHTRLELDDSTSEEKTRHYSWDIQVRGGKECKYSHICCWCKLLVQQQPKLFVQGVHFLFATQTAKDIPITM